MYTEEALEALYEAQNTDYASYEGDDEDLEYCEIDEYYPCEESDEDDSYEDDPFLEVGFDPYMGCYSDDC